MFVIGTPSQYRERHREAKWILVLLGEAALGEQLDQQALNTEIFLSTPPSYHSYILGYLYNK